MINLNSINKENKTEISKDINYIKKNYDDFLIKNAKIKTEMKVLEFSNFIDSVEKEKLNGQNGYYSKKGLDAIDENAICAKKVFEEIVNLVNEKQRELKLKEGYGFKIAEITKEKKLNTILKGIIAHEMRETINWETQVIEEAKINAINKGVLYRDKRQDLFLALQNGRTVILYKGKILNSKIEEIKAELQKFESDFYSNIIMAFAKEKNKIAKVYYEENKEKIILPNREKLEKIVCEVEKNCEIDEVSTSLFTLYSNNPKVLENKINALKKYKEEIKNKIYSLMKNKNIKEENLQDNVIKEFFDVVKNRQNEGNLLDLKDIPVGLNVENMKEAEKFIEKINKEGFIKSNDIVFLNLFERFKDPEKFKRLKLQKYRFYLSREDVDIFLKCQQKNNFELSDIYDLISKKTEKIKDIGNKTDIIRKILNDFEEEKSANGKPLNFEEKQKIANIRAGK